MERAPSKSWIVESQAPEYSRVKLGAKATMRPHCAIASKGDVGTIGEVHTR